MLKYKTIEKKINYYNINKSKGKLWIFYLSKKTKD